MESAKQIKNVINELIEKLDKKKLPEHVAIIMDGNGRWAKKRHLPRIMGHRVGSKRVHEIVEIASHVGIKVLTLYAFSTENWHRPTSEIKTLMHLLKYYLKYELPSMQKKKVRLVTSGRTEEFPTYVKKELYKTMETTQKNNGLILNLALNYGGRAEIVDALKKIAEKVAKQELNTNEINENLIKKHLYNNFLPEPDLLIRTSGERRLSNFLLWELAYTELYFTPVLWPDFDREQFLLALVEFQNRERRFGAIT